MKIEKNKRKCTSKFIQSKKHDLAIEEKKIAEKKQSKAYFIKIILIETCKDATKLQL